MSITAMSKRLGSICLPSDALISVTKGSALQCSIGGCKGREHIIRVAKGTFFRIGEGRTHPFSIRATVARIAILNADFRIDRRPSVARISIIAKGIHFTTKGRPRPIVLATKVSTSCSGRGGRVSVLGRRGPGGLS